MAKFLSLYFTNFETFASLHKIKISVFMFMWFAVYYFLDESFIDENEVTWETNEGERHTETHLLNKKNNIFNNTIFRWSHSCT